MPKPREAIDNTFKPEETLTAGVRFIAAHHCGPLLGGHGAGAGIGKQIKQHIAGAKLEQVISGLLEQDLALFGGGTSERLDAFDPERLDDRLHGGNRSLRIAAKERIEHKDTEIRNIGFDSSVVIKQPWIQRGTRVSGKPRV